MAEPVLNLSPSPGDEVKTTTCYMCACRCGIKVWLQDGQIRYIQGNRDHPVNQGVLCAKGAAGIVIHNFYVPAGGDIPDPGLNEKFAHKLEFLRELRERGGRLANGAPAILVGDLNVAPLEHDVWSHKQLLDVVSHTPVETEALETLR